MQSKHFVRAFAISSVCLIACAIDSAPNGLKDTPAGNGPTIQFDLSHRPLPLAPLPNDIATLADPSSRTGLRINASLVAPTAMEAGARAALDDLEGWGTFAPISVSFDRGANSDPRQPAIDLDDVIARMQNDGHDFSNDPLYVINLKTGVPAMLDMGDGNFPITLQRTGQYWDNDLKANESNLLFETQEEGPGLVQQNYTPAIDQDFDGVLDHPNTWPSNGRPNGINGVDNVLSWYERETDSLIVRPLLPLDEKTEYAVVLTDRLRGLNGSPVKSPFPEIYHPLQRSETARVRDIISDASHANYFGDISGTGLDHVAFVWSYTTAPTAEDLHLLRDGLYGKGPFASFSTNVPVNLTIQQAKGLARIGNDEPDGFETNPSCVARGKNNYSVTFDDQLRAFFSSSVFESLFGYSAGQTAALDSAVENIDHVVIGSYKSPFLLGDPASTDIESRFHLDFKTGAGNVTTDDVHFWLVVPKARPGMTQPFPITFWGHGAGGSDTEVMLYAGDFARQGIATIGIDMPEHGLYLDQGNQSLLSGSLVSQCLVPWVDAVSTGREHDLDGDGIPDSGLFWWTSHIAHTRDVVRQGTLDEMQGVRIMRAFGTQLGQDFDGDGKPELLGDFDADGTPDVAGPAPIFVAGESLGGIMGEILGGAEPYIQAAAPMSGGGGLTDVGFRSYGVTEAVVLEQVSPIIFAVPASDRKPDSDGTLNSRCTGDQRSVRELIDDGYNSVEVEIACLNSGELAPSSTVLVTNFATHQVHCGRTWADGRFRIPLPSTAGDPIDIQVFNGPDLVDNYKDCKRSADADNHIGRHINTFEQNQIDFAPVVGAAACSDPTVGCVQWDGVFYDVGSPLLALQDGLGYSRQTPDIRKLRDLAQSGLSGADPIDYAPYYMMKPLTDENGVASPPHALLSIQTVGDGFVPLATGHAFARAAGALPFLTPDFVTKFPEYADYATPSDLYTTYGKTPNDVLIDSGETEGAPRLERVSAGPNCGVNYAAANNPTACNAPPAVDPTVCAQTIYDADWLSEGANNFDAPHPAVPLRLARISGLHVTDASSLGAAWAPREAGVPFATTGWDSNTNHQRLLGIINMYVKPQGNHTWDTGDVCRAWDFATYGNGMIARFLQSNGTDLYYLSHPSTHECLENLSCDFFK